MEVLNFIEAGVKLGLKGAELQAWAEQQAEYALEEIARAQEFESRRIESERHKFELERDVLDRKLRLEALQTRIPILGTPDENEGPAEAPNNNLTSPAKVIPKFTEESLLTNGKSRCQMSWRDVQCDSHIEHMQAVIDLPKPPHMGIVKDFSRPEMLINGHNTFNSTFTLENERTDRQYQDLANSQDLFCPKVLNKEQGRSSSCFLFAKAVTTIPLIKEYDTSMEATKVHYVIDTERIIKDDLIGFNTSPIASTEQPKCSEMERVAGLSACFLDSQPSKNASQVSPTSDIACVHLCRASPLMKTSRENKFKERLHSRQQQYKTRPKALKFAQCKWDADCRQGGAHNRCFLNTLASESQTYWCHAAHRKFVRYKKSKAVHWQAAASVTHIVEKTSTFVLLCASHENVFWL